MTQEKPKAFDISYDLSNGNDESAVVLRVGAKMHIIPDPFASYLIPKLQKIKQMEDAER